MADKNNKAPEALARIMEAARGSDYAYEGLNADSEVVRKALASIPSPPVSGEAVKLPRKFNPNHGWAHAMQADEPAFLLRYDDPERKDLIFTGYGAEEAALKMWEAANNSWNCALFKTMRTSPLTNKPVGQFDTSDYIIVGSDGKPRRNEPVGVTISREDAELFKSIASALSDDRKFITCKPDFYRGLCDRLSAAIGELG